MSGGGSGSDASVYSPRPLSRRLPGGLPRRTAGNLTTTVSVAAPTVPPTLVGSTRTRMVPILSPSQRTGLSQPRRMANHTDPTAQIGLTFPVLPRATLLLIRRPPSHERGHPVFDHVAQTD